MDMLTDRVRGGPHLKVVQLQFMGRAIGVFEADAFSGIRAKEKRFGLVGFHRGPSVATGIGRHIVIQDVNTPL